MKWGKQRNQHSSSSSGLSFSLALFPKTWFLKLRQRILSKPTTINPTPTIGTPPSATKAHATTVSTDDDEDLSFSTTIGHFMTGGGEHHRQMPCFTCKDEVCRHRNRRDRSFRSGSDRFSISFEHKAAALVRSRSERLEPSIPSTINGNQTRLNVSEKNVCNSRERKYSSPSSISGRMRHRHRKNHKIKVNSPRLVGRKKKKTTTVQESKPRSKTRSLESFAITKKSANPQRDFRDSMVEMILENKLIRPGELESLLACYLSLNADEYHDVIVKVFRQVWFDLMKNHQI